MRGRADSRTASHPSRRTCRGRAPCARPPPPSHAASWPGSCDALKLQRLSQRIVLRRPASPRPAGSAANLSKHRLVQSVRGLARRTLVVVELDDDHLARRRECRDRRAAAGPTHRRTASSASDRRRRPRPAAACLTARRRTLLREERHDRRRSPPGTGCAASSVVGGATTAADHSRVETGRQLHDETDAASAGRDENADAPRRRCRCTARSRSSA